MRIHPSVDQDPRAFGGLNRCLTPQHFGAILDVQQADVALALCGRASDGVKADAIITDGKSHLCVPQFKFDIDVLGMGMGGNIVQGLLEDAPEAG